MFQLGQGLVIGFDHFEVNGDTLLDRGIIKALDDSFTVLGFGNETQEVGEIILASGILDMSKELGPFSHGAPRAKPVVPP